ncbi:aminotransferase [Acidaminobacter sp. JC074]|uniref:aminotransferase n=1 Tax=Acidaminobacter sp. JC074 TaxID=2530199 RepID=UPI001F0CE2E0|nr:aminotransferase [Acidaminobacter sp. JC074]MCH4886971.1 aminotransferase [Acidaminobacter sp. JC074]
MKIKDFGVEIWMNLYENNCKYNLAETCVESMTVKELLTLAGNQDEVMNNILNMQMSYGDIEGSDKLVTGVRSLYKTVKPEQVTITHGAIGANALTMFSLIEPGDRVVSVLPTYQQHYSIPEAYGADVQILKLKPENKFLPDLEELASLVNDNTKLICINNPNNPTGALMDEAFLKEIVEIAKSVDAYVICDEVYRGLDHEGSGFTTSIVDLYDKGISSGSISKTFSLAGLRIGWLAGPEDFIEKVNRRRDYTTISCGRIDDYLASIALENKDKIIERNHKIVRDNIKILDEWVQKEPKISYVKPKAGTTAFLKYDFDMPSEEFCIKLLESKGVMLVPGSALHTEGFLRIGYAFSPSALKEGLDKFSEFLEELSC